MPNISSCSLNDSSCDANFPQILPWYTDAFTVTFVILYALVITATIVGNLLVCAAVVVNANLRHVVSSYFIVSLAISDLATACFSMPFDMEYLITSGLWPRGEDFCIVWTTVYMIAIPTSILNLLVLSIDRYKTLKDPWDRFRESPFITKRRAVIAILVLWGYSLAFALVPITGVKHYPSSLYQGTCIFNMAPIYSVVGSFVNFVLPMLIMCCMYYKIFRIAHTKYRMPSRPKRDMHQVMQLPAMNEESKSPPDAEKVPPAVNNIRNSTKLRSRKKSAKKNNNSPEKAGLENAGFEESELESPRVSVLVHRGVTERESVTQYVHRDVTERENVTQPDLNNVKRAQCNDDDREKKRDRIDDKIQIAKAGDRSEGDGEEATTPNDYMEGDKDRRDTSWCQTTDDDDSREVESIDAENAEIKNVNSVAVASNTDNANDDDDNNDKTFSNQICTAVEREGSGLLSDRRSQSGGKERSVHPLHSKVHAAGPSPNSDNSSGAASTGFPASRSSIRVEIANNDSDTSSVGTCDTTGSPVPGMPSSKMTYTGGETPEAFRKRCSTMQTDVETDTKRKSTIELTAPATNQEPPPEPMNFGSMEDLTIRRKKYFVKNAKAARTISVIVGAFLLCWGPFVLFSIVMNICWMPCAMAVPYHVHHVFLLMGYINSMVNPLLFSYQNHQFRKAYWKIAMTVFPCVKHNEVLPR
ncbi:putative tyramine receptor 2 [Nematostella vectensis]|uniref:putative tyramine receptor 2 n=1 Tax=Nematostella vectensis TaxID=45351 RepID=UPI00138FC14F|nr:putative tyramine receptor 2 [Nematostella vectensis]